MHGAEWATHPQVGIGKHEEGSGMQGEFHIGQIGGGGGGGTGGAIGPPPVVRQYFAAPSQRHPPQRKSDGA